MSAIKTSSDRTRTARLDNPANNESIKIYDDWTVEHEYDGYPAQGVIQADIESVELLSGTISDEDLDFYEGEILQNIQDALMGDYNSECDINHISGDTYEFEEVSSGEKYTFALVESNEERIR